MDVFSYMKSTPYYLLSWKSQKTNKQGIVLCTLNVQHRKDFNLLLAGMLKKKKQRSKNEKSLFLGRMFLIQPFWKYYGYFSKNVRIKLLYDIESTFRHMHFSYRTSKKYPLPVIF